MTTSESPIVAEAESYVRLIADELTAPREGECVCCYLARLLEAFGCDGTHRHTVRFRDAQAPRATALLQRLRTAGGYCDCEVLLNVFVCADAAPTVLVDEDGFEVEVDPPEVPASCTGVRRGSARPCDSWVRRRRWR